MNLHTTDLPLTINREFYNDLVDNFIQIGALEGQVGALEGQVGALEDRVKQLQENDKDHEKRLKRIEALEQELRSEMVAADESNLAAMTAKAERVALGIDMDTLRLAVEAVLKEKGMID